MREENKECYSRSCRPQDSGISHILSCCNDSIKAVILNLIQDLQPLLCLLCQGIRGRCQIKFAMTPLSNKGAFTLIELLVVVLIIGILAAVALPQYQKAIYKTRYTTLKPLCKALAQAQESYFLAHGSFAEDIEALDINLPPGGTLVEGKPQLNFPWGWCGLDGRRTYCKHAAASMGYAIYLHPFQQYCSFYGSNKNDIRVKICKEEAQATGEPTYDGVGQYRYFW